MFVELSVSGHHSTSKTSAPGRTPPLLHGARNVSKSLHICDEGVQLGDNTNPGAELSINIYLILHPLKVNEVISFVGFRYFFPVQKLFTLPLKTVRVQ